jgi:hypothetical protein
MAQQRRDSDSADEADLIRIARTRARLANGAAKRGAGHRPAGPLRPMAVGAAARELGSSRGGELLNANEVTAHMRTAPSVIRQLPPSLGATGACVIALHVMSCRPDDTRETRDTPAPAVTAEGEGAALDAGASPPEGTCMETRSTRMESDGRCADVITSTCPTNLGDKALVPGCTLLGNEVELSIDPDLVTLWPEVQAAMDRIEGLTPLRYTQPEVSAPDFIPDLVQIIREPFGPDPGITGTTQCFRRLADGQRFGCVVWLHPGALALTPAGRTDPEGTAIVNAMHELGHVACLEHEHDTCSDRNITAMNSAHLVDGVRPQSDYMTFTPTELLQISSVIRPAAVAPTDDAGAADASAPPGTVEQDAGP